MFQGLMFHESLLLCRVLNLELTFIVISANNCYHLWDFLRQSLEESRLGENKFLHWVNEAEGEFRIIDTKMMAAMWGERKHSKCMTYEKLSRTLRYYCQLNILQKKEGTRLRFRFSEGKKWSNPSSTPDRKFDLK